MPQLSQLPYVLWSQLLWLAIGLHVDGAFDVEERRHIGGVHQAHRVLIEQAVAARGADGWSRATAHNRAQILYYLAEGTPYLPEEKLERAQVLRWMFFEQYSHEPYIAVARFIRGWTPARAHATAPLS